MLNHINHIRDNDNTTNTCKIYWSHIANENYTITRCTQREQNARLLVTSLSSDIKYCTEDNKIKPNM